MSQYEFVLQNSETVTRKYRLIRAYNAYRVTWLPGTARRGDRYHSTLASCGCCGPGTSPRPAVPGSHELDPFGNATEILRWVDHVQ